MTSGRMIDYEALAQDAMRGVVRTILARVAKSGLPGDHHFYVSFSTNATGVSVSKRLKEKYPDEMTIVLQHRFWDLAVNDERFEVKLTFDGIPERLVVPFSAIKVFFDPSVRYGLQFEAPDFGPDAVSHPQGDQTGAADGERSGPAIVQAGAQTRTPRPGGERKPRPQRKPRPDKIGEVAAMPRAGETAGPTTEPAARPAPEPTAANSDAAAGSPSKPAAAKPAASGAKILSLDSFRKK